MRTIKTRIFSCLLAVMLAIPAFSMSALCRKCDDPLFIRQEICSPFCPSYKKHDMKTPPL